MTLELQSTGTKVNSKGKSEFVITNYSVMGRTVNVREEGKKDTGAGTCSGVSANIALLTNLMVFF